MDVEASLRFYVDLLGFTSPWPNHENGRVKVAQVDRQGCAPILAGSWPEKRREGAVFISLHAASGTPEAATAALDALHKELEVRSVPVKEDWWGYRLLVVDGLDGNQLFLIIRMRPHPLPGLERRDEATRDRSRQVRWNSSVFPGQASG